MDHEMVSMLARAASFAYGIPNVSALPRPADAVVPHLYYCDPIGGVDPYGKPVEPTTFVDVTRQYEKKQAMLACHASQREWLRAHHGMDEYLEAMKRHAAARGKQVGDDVRRGVRAAPGALVPGERPAGGAVQALTSPLRARGNKAIIVAQLHPPLAPAHNPPRDCHHWERRMLNYIWAGLIIFSFVFALVNDVRDLRERHVPQRQAAARRHRAAPAGGSQVNVRIDPAAYKDALRRRRAAGGRRTRRR